VDEATWIAANAARLGRALARPQVRAELLALLGTDDAERRRQRRLVEARAELAGLGAALADRGGRGRMGSLETVFAVVVTVLAAVAVIGALVFAVVWEWAAVRRTLADRRDSRPPSDADFWPEQRALQEPPR
jgi:hypothetical protein